LALRLITKAAERDGSASVKGRAAAAVTALYSAFTESVHWTPPPTRLNMQNAGEHTADRLPTVTPLTAPAAPKAVLEIAGPSSPLGIGLSNKLAKEPCADAANTTISAITDDHDDDGDDSDQEIEQELTAATAAAAAAAAATAAAAAAATAAAAAAATAAAAAASSTATVPAESETEKDKQKASDDSGTQAVRGGNELIRVRVTSLPDIHKHFLTFGASTHHIEIQDHKYMTERGRELYGVRCMLCSSLPVKLSRQKNATTAFRVLQSDHPGVSGEEGYASRKRARTDELASWTNVLIVCRNCHTKAPTSRTKKRARLH
jgi:chemotaxis protein histidine kinase CheA